MKIFNILLILLLVVASSEAAGLSTAPPADSPADPAVNLVTLQQAALENREVIDRFRVNLEQAGKNLVIARSGYQPSLDFAYTVNTLNDGGLNTFETSPNSLARAAVSLNLFAGFRDKYNIRSAELLRRAEEHRLTGLGQDIRLNVALLYLTIYDSRSRLTVAEDQHATLEKIYRDAVNRFEVGLIDKNELLRFKVDLDNAAISHRQARAELDKNLQLLKREIDAEVELERLTFDEFDDLPALADGEEQYRADMLENRSEIRTLEEVARAADLAVGIEHAAYYPRLDLVGSYSRFEDAVLSGSGDDGIDEVRGQVVLSMNLYDGRAKRHREARAALEARGVRLDLAELQKDLTTQLTNLFLDYRVNVDNTGAALAGIEQAEENLRITRLKYEQGLQRESDLLDAIANLSRARSNFVTAKTRVFANYFQIERMAERP